MPMRVLSAAGIFLSMSLGAAIFPSNSKAATYDFLASSCNVCGGSSGVIAQAVTSVVGSDLQITLSIKNSDYFFFQAGNPPILWFNLDKTSSLSSASPTSVGPVATPTSLSWNSLYGTDTSGTALSGNEQAPSGGTFYNAIGYAKNNVIFNDPIIFTLTSITASDLVSVNPGQFFELDICNSSSASSGDAGCTSGSTGYIFADRISNETITPLPAALPLFATGLGGFALLGLFRKRKVAAI